MNITTNLEPNFKCKYMLFKKDFKKRRKKEPSIIFSGFQILIIFKINEAKFQSYYYTYKKNLHYNLLKIYNIFVVL